MVKITKPENLNGLELVNELKTQNITVLGFPIIDGNGDFWLDIDEADAAKAEAIAKKHNGTTVAPELTITDKLAYAGISLDELKTALGL
jgi:hypothetical protein